MSTVTVIAGPKPKPKPKPEAIQRRLTLFRQLLIWSYCGSFAFDFKGEEEGGGIAQYVMLVAAIASAGLLLVTGQTRSQSVSRSLSRATCLWIAYLAVTLVTCSIYAAFGITDTSLYRYSRVIIPYLMFGLSLLVVGALRADDMPPRRLLTALFVTAILSSVWRYIYATKIASIIIVELRYQILSPAIAFLIAAGCVELVLSRDPKLSRLSAMMMAICMILLSVTRSYLLVVLNCLLACVWIAWWNRRRVPRLGCARIKAIVMVAVMSFAGTITLFIVRPNVGDAWSERMFHHAGGKTERDLTMMTREAEALGIWEALREDPVYLLVGRGVGASFSWHPSYEGALRRVVRKVGHINVWSIGHSMWTFSLFSSGFLFGPIVLFSFLHPLIKGLRASGRYSKIPGQQTPRIFVLPSVTLLGYLSLSFTANPFAERYGGLIMGLCAGMVYSNDRLTSGRFPSRKIGGRPRDFPDEGTLR